ncbi:MAG: exodeoxyribonuclease VII small subunit, partial [Firmicutes bacterium]|nr:exodeoxyribonuclease VII small subunit [Bacillota bacterium]
SRLESRDLALDKALELFKRGISLSAYCNTKLEEVQGLVKLLTQNQGELEEVPMNSLKGE